MFHKQFRRRWLGGQHTFPIKIIKVWQISKNNCGDLMIFSHCLSASSWHEHKEPSNKIWNISCHRIFVTCASIYPSVASRIDFVWTLYSWNLQPFCHSMRLSMYNFWQEPENEASRKKRWEGGSRKIPSKCNNGIMRSPQIDSQGTLENIWMGLSRGEQGELQVFWGEWGFILVFKVEFLR